MSGSAGATPSKRKGAALSHLSPDTPVVQAVPVPVHCSLTPTPNAMTTGSDAHVGTDGKPAAETAPKIANCHRCAASVHACRNHQQAWVVAVARWMPRANNVTTRPGPKPPRTLTAFREQYVKRKIAAVNKERDKQLEVLTQQYHVSQQRAPPKKRFVVLLIVWTPCIACTSQQCLGLHCWLPISIVFVVFRVLLFACASCFEPMKCMRRLSTPYTAFYFTCHMQPTHFDCSHRHHARNFWPAIGDCQSQFVSFCVFFLSCLRLISNY